MNILELFKRPARTSDELKEKLAQINAQLPALNTLCDAAEAERGRGLLTLGDRELEMVESRLARVRRDRDRAEAACAELQRQIADVERKEAHDELSRRRAQVEGRASGAAKRLSADFVRASETIAAIVTEVFAVEAEVRTLNIELVQAGRGAEAVDGPEARVRMVTSSGLSMPLAGSVSLPPVGAFRGIGHALHEAERLGVPLP